jgi:hypothetical protein
MSNRQLKTVVAAVFAIVLSYFLYVGIYHNSSSQPSGLGNQVAQTSLPTERCVAQNGLPDSRCTPGMADSRVTQANIYQTICVSGYTKTVRPPVSYTGPLKAQLMQKYGDTDSPKNYELDHFIPLEVGGSPTDVRNLWPEPGFGQDNFHNKDGLENYLHSRVCAGSISLHEAQTELSTNWIRYWNQYGQPK